MEAFGQFFETVFGRILVFLIAVVFFGLISLILKSKKTLTPKAITYSAIAIAIATVLSNIKLFELPAGGSVTLCSMLFITLIGYWFGPSVGVLSGIAYGFIQLALGPYVIHPVQLLLDYPLAFGALGLSGLRRNAKTGIQPGYLLGVTGRFLFSFLSGFIFFGSYAPEGMSPVMYSFLYSIAYCGVEAFITMLIVSVPSVGNAVDVVKRQIEA